MDQLWTVIPAKNLTQHFESDFECIVGAVTSLRSKISQIWHQQHKKRRIPGRRACVGIPARMDALSYLDCPNKLHGAQVPIVMAFVDDQKRRGGVGGVFNTAGDYQADLAAIQAAYQRF